MCGEKLWATCSMADGLGLGLLGGSSPPTVEAFMRAPSACVLRLTAGQMLFVPSGWWHCCLNLEPSIAITQNYAPRSSASKILRYLAAGDKVGALVSGVEDRHRPHMAEQFERIVRTQCPEALVGEQATTRPEEAGDEARATARKKAVLERQPPPRPAAAAPPPPADFRFGF